MHDPTFAERCRLWTTLLDVIPEPHQEEVERIAAALDSAYWEIANERTRLYHSTVSELRQAKQQIEDMETRIRDLALLAAPTDHTH